MHSYRIVWEDEAKAREIELLVHYRLDAGTVSIGEVRPTAVTLYCAHTGKPRRTLPVHTPTGRRLLAEAFLSGRQGDLSLEDEIRAAHDQQAGAVTMLA